MSDFRLIEIPSVVDIPRMLRNIADEIESGDYGFVDEGALVLNGSQLELFGLGKADSTTTHYLFCCAAAKMQRPAAERG